MSLRRRARRVRDGLARARAKLGRCIRCMTLTAIGLAACAIAIALLGPDRSPVVVLPVYSVGLAFAALAALHIIAIVYRGLVRLEGRVATAAGGCRCSGRSLADHE